MTPHLLISLLTILAALLVATRAQAADPPKGATIAREIVATWVCQDNLGVPRTPARNPWNLKHHSAAYKAWLLNAWTLRHTDCRESLAAKKRQWNWQAWLPDKWRRIGQCETQLNWFHHNSGYQGAFGFATQSWDAFKLPGYPEDANQASPWQQYQVALAIYNRYGLSGWGCRGA